MEPQGVRELGGGGVAAVGGQQRGEHARGHARHPALLEHGREPFDEPRDLVSHRS